ncbi:ATP-binding domain-containing protein [Rahnella perminowiae]|uniref:DEAD/DEAH box helicase n=1 Tax=Rahnella perminowiae TaxID=2816244 RepID=UPI00224AB95D|nr:ATP-binding domain-containing protein [Rahnella perminowiae]MCX2943242.1 ATP-binding domain-containing protein [Rahnella perminowiae]
MINVINGATDKPVTSQTLRAWFGALDELEGTLYIGYPIIGTVDGAYEIDALLVSPLYGVVAFTLIEGNELPSDNENIQDECFNMLEAKLRQYKELIEKRTLLVPITVVTIAPVVNQAMDDPHSGYPVITKETSLVDMFSNINWDGSELYKKVVSVIQAVSRVKVTKKRTNITKPDSKGAILVKLDQSITNLDSQQSKAVLETVHGVQRIRGLAGSGKTIVLARKIAYLHAKNRDWKIAVTFNTRSLKNQFIKLITSFVYEQTSEIPDWDRIKIIHAWGSSKTEGVYYNACIDNNIEYFDFGTAKDKYGADKAFKHVCERFLNAGKEISPAYDLILVDEAQDFSVEFLKLCYLLLDGNKRLVYAYDELQTLNESSMSSPEEIWGSDSNGKPLVSLINNKDEPDRDIMLEKCYRNPGPVLTTAHALGFGIYREILTGFGTDGKPFHARQLVQMFDYAPLWEDIGYEVLDGELKEGQAVVLKRKRDASPEFLENHSPIEDVINFSVFSEKDAQTVALVDAIEKNIREDELKPDDIMVIHSDPKTTRTAVADARNLLFKRGISSTLAGVSGSPDDFFEEDSVMFTSIYRAKGNEAAMVYVINAQYCAEGHGLGTKRNILFTAMTRTKAWLRVFGIGGYMQMIKNEFECVRDNNFELHFKYPTDEERKYLRVVNRDMTMQEKNRISKRQNQLEEVVGELLSGEIHKEDLSQDVLDKLRKALGI